MHTFTYDYEGKMQLAVSIAAPNNMVEYKYDPMGNRIGRVEYDASGIASERKYVLDYTSSVPKVLLELEKNISGVFDVIQKNYYYGNRLVMSTDGNDSNRRYYIHDRLGSVRCVVDVDTLTVYNNYTYTPFGEDIASQTSEAVENEIRFAGYNYDDDLGQYYVWARMYSPYMARFNGYDPVLGSYKEPLTLHQYLYCLNDPVNRIDPSGRFSYAEAAITTAEVAILTTMAAQAAEQIGGRLKGNLISSVFKHQLSLAITITQVQSDIVFGSKIKDDKSLDRYYKSVEHNHGTSSEMPDGEGPPEKDDPKFKWWIIAKIFELFCEYMDN